MKQPLPDRSCEEIAAWLHETGNTMLRTAAQLDFAGPGAMIPTDETVYAGAALELCKDLHRLFARWARENPVFEPEKKEIH